MKLLHVTHNKNVNSIIKNGLLPSFIELDGHWDEFQEFLRQRYCIYFWNAETYMNGKFIRDLIYTKMFIHPRNKIITQIEVDVENKGLDPYDEEHYLDIRTLGGKLVGDSGSYSVLELDIADADAHGVWKHIQEPHDDKFMSSTIMDDYYAHDDKELYVGESAISFTDINIVEEVQVRKYKNNDLGFTFRRN